MENKFKSKLILPIAIGLVIFIIISVWLLLYSSWTANNSLVVKIRNSYYSIVLPKLGLNQDNLPYSLLQIKKDSKHGYYTYSLLGKFENFDFTNHLIYLKDKDNKTYAITYHVKNTVNSPNLTFITYQDFINQKPTTGSYIEFNSDKPDEVDSKFAVGDVIEIQWEDFRTLEKIKTKYSNNEILIERDVPVLNNSPQVVNRYLYEK